MSKKILISLLATVFPAIVYLAEAQQPGRIPTIGFMRGGSPTDAEVEAFRQGLRELGYVEEKTSSLSTDIREVRPIVFPTLRLSWSA